MPQYNQPLVSIITVVYNNSTHIRGAIESVLSQDYPRIEHIVIDGGSSDGSLEILNSYFSDIDCLISEPDNGIYSAINKGLSKATGDIIGLLHAGDLFYDNNVISNIAGCFNQVSVIKIKPNAISNKNFFSNLTTHFFPQIRSN